MSVSIIFLAINGIKRRATLRSLLRENGLWLFDSMTPICSIDDGLTAIVATDEFEGACSNGLLDGTQGIPSQRVRQLFDGAAALGSPLFLMRAIVPTTSIQNPNPSLNVILKVRESMPLSSLPVDQALPANIVFMLS